MKAGSTLYSDELASCNGLDKLHAHKVINHAMQYVDGKIHVNGMENFWALLMRALGGTYEQAYRFNEWHGKNWDHFKRAIHRVTGRRVTWKRLTGQGHVSESIA